MGGWRKTRNVFLRQWLCLGLRVVVEMRTGVVVLIPIWRDIRRVRQAPRRPWPCRMSRRQQDAGRERCSKIDQVSKWRAASFKMCVCTYLCVWFTQIHSFGGHQTVDVCVWIWGASWWWRGPTGTLVVKALATTAVRKGPRRCIGHLRVLWFPTPSLVQNHL